MRSRALPLPLPHPPTHLSPPPHFHHYRPSSKRTSSTTTKNVHWRPHRQHPPRRPRPYPKSSLVSARRRLLRLLLLHRRRASFPRSPVRRPCRQRRQQRRRVAEWPERGGGGCAAAGRGSSWTALGSVRGRGQRAAACAVAAGHPTRAVLPPLGRRCCRRRRRWSRPLPRPQRAVAAVAGGAGAWRPCCAT